MFAPLHTKSEYSHGYGSAGVADLAARAALAGYPALALTDIENLSGQVPFHHAARAQGITPITGVELRGGFSSIDSGRSQGRLVLLARDRAGYESLCRIITMRRGGGPDTTTDPLRCLEAFPSGLFYLSDDPVVIGRLLADGVAMDDVRYLVADPATAVPVARVRAVADPDVVMLEPEDQGLHLLLTAIRRRCKVSAVVEPESEARSFPELTMLLRRFGEWPELLAESLRVAEACRLDLTEDGATLPLGRFSNAAAAWDALARRCRRRLGEADSARAERLDRELSGVRDLGWAGFLLCVAEITDAARVRGIPMIGRGSVTGSLVAYLLGLTTVDPVAHALSSERFLHPRSGQLPDLELSVASQRRDQLIDWVFERFGADRVAMVGAQQTFGRRAAFREGLKACGMDVAGIDRFLQAFPATEADGAGGAPLPLHLLPARFQESVPLIERLIGKPRQLSAHPGGIVIAETRVDQHAPLERSPKGVPVVQYDMASLAGLGVITLDLRQHRALAAHAEAMRLLGERIGTPDGDVRTVECLRAGNTLGCIHIEGPVARSILQRLPVRGMTDLMAALAVVRPGPGASDAKAELIRRANGESGRDPPHPRLLAQLRESYGLPLFEEDLVAGIATLTGWPTGAAEEMRAGVVSSEAGGSVRLSLKRRFLVAASHTGVVRGDGERAWQVVERFAGYSSNKAGAAGDTQLAWEAAFLKTHHPAAFACAVLSHYDGPYPLRAIASDFVRCGVRILAPHVNISAAEHQLVDGGVRLGLSAVKCLTARNREWLLQERPFTDLGSLISRVRLSAAELESLILSGACDDLAPLAGAAYPFPHEELLTRWKREPGLRGLLGFVARNARGEIADTYRALARIRNETRFLGMHPSAHPMRVLRAEADREGCITTPQVREHVGQFVQLAAVVVASRPQADRTGRMQQHLTLDDEHGLAEAVLSPGSVDAGTDPVAVSNPYLLAGWIEGDRSHAALSVSEMKPFQLRAAPFTTAGPA